MKTLFLVAILSSSLEKPDKFRYDLFSDVPENQWVFAAGEKLTKREFRWFDFDNDGKLDDFETKRMKEGVRRWRCNGVVMHDEDPIWFDPEAPFDLELDPFEP